MTTITMHPATLRKSPHRGGSRSAKANRRRAVGVPAMLHQHLLLSEPAHDLWVEGRLMEELSIPDDKRTRVEIIGGEIVVSPGPLVDHAFIISDIQEAFSRRRILDADFPWRTVQVVDFNLPRIGDGYIPDLVVLNADVFEAAARQRLRNLTADQVGLVVEITSKATAADDREPGRQRARPTKWNGYAHEEVEFYLLVDRAPNKALATLYSEPNPARGLYLDEQRWKFGETITLPEPFGVEIPTEDWLTWEK
ncbi:Uma2 family endonuclease [Actinocrinis puniceicyclus]|uniref:Uma2 family endonuclease n=1 Tax=Actinocrinis puniceicyclus TaxID=977794 RepID=A0A8J7WRA1_9ACTN|nr:Uma2 family endonuclease [Actinocrinis puniceicyclus]MBS2966063.1 Uma2 family endonuclease [Actinocrinis puniceicyclus]